MLRSLCTLSAFAAGALAQVGAPQPIVSTVTPDAPAVTSCSGCFVVADVAQVIFAEFTSTQTASVIVSDGQGRNGSTIKTTLFQPAAPFSFDPNGLLSGSPVQGSYVPITGTVFTVNGIALTSPTAANVFTAFTRYDRVVDAAGNCGSSQAFVSVLSSAFSVSLVNGAPASAIFDAENSFIAAQPRLTCAAGPIQVTQTIPVPVVTTTATSSTTGIFRPTPIAQTSSGAASTTSDSGITLVLSTETVGGTESVVTLTPTPNPTQSITTGAAAGVHPSSGSATLLLVLFAIPGLAAYML